MTLRRIAGHLVCSLLRIEGAGFAVVWYHRDDTVLLPLGESFDAGMNAGNPVCSRRISAFGEQTIRRGADLKRYHAGKCRRAEIRYSIAIQSDSMIDYKCNERSTVQDRDRGSMGPGGCSND